MAKHYTKAGARRACTAIQQKLRKMMFDGYITSAMFVKLSEPYDKLRHKLK
tara:strand:- start:338 stop:490 length:153 start_codon:yes stop_codon:yes gene_type:complete